MKTHVKYFTASIICLLIILLMAVFGVSCSPQKAVITGNVEFIYHESDSLTVYVRHKVKNTHFGYHHLVAKLPASDSIKLGQKIKLHPTNKNNQTIFKHIKK